jgi:hypothetical protein
VGNCQGFRLGYMYNSDKDLDTTRNAAIGDLLVFSGHAAGRLKAHKDSSGVGIDVWGELAPAGVLLGQVKTGESRQIVAYKLEGTAGFGISLGKVGHLSNEFKSRIIASGECRSRPNGQMNEKGEALTSQRCLQDSDITISDTISLDRIGGTPVFVNARYEKGWSWGSEAAFDLYGAQDRGTKSVTKMMVGTGIAY